MRVFPILLPLLMLAACKPPASDEYVERARIGGPTEGPSEPIDTPDTEGAIWAPAMAGERLLYGKPGAPPLFALECVTDTSSGTPTIAYTRFAQADPRAKAILALIGNGHVSRLMIDAKQIGDAWRWEGSVAAEDQRLDALTGARSVEATVPGAGSIILNASALPGELVESCRTRTDELEEPFIEPGAPFAPAGPA